MKPDALRKRLFLSKVCHIKTVFHRGMPASGVLKTCTVVSELNGEWYVSLVYEDNVQRQETAKASISPVGIDLGLKSLIATTDGVKIPHWQFLRKAERRLKRLQQNFARTQNGSGNRDRTRK